MQIASNVVSFLGYQGSAESVPHLVTFLSIGVTAVAGLVAVISYVQARRLLAHAEYSEGAVIRLSQTFTRGGQLYAPVFRFTSGDGTTHTAESSIFKFPPKFQVGDKIRIIYHRDHPEKAEYVGRFAQWGVTLISGALALWALLIAILVLLLWR